MNHQVSIYNPNGTSSLPGHKGFPKSREDNESHVYASIEDTLVYTHLLRQGVEMGVYGEVDTYQSFTGPSDPPKPPPSLGSFVERPSDPPKPPLSLGSVDERPEVGQPFVPASQQGPPLPNRPPSQGKPMVENDLYCTKIYDEVDSSQDLTGNQEQGPRMEPEGGE